MPLSCLGEGVGILGESLAREMSYYWPDSKFISMNLYAQLSETEELSPIPTSTLA